MLVAILLAGCLPGSMMDCGSRIDEDSAAVVGQRLKIWRHAVVDMDNKKVDCNLAGATEALRTDDGAADIACNVRLMREGDVAVFDDGDGSIDNEAEFDVINELPGDVKLVNEINWCDRLIPDVIGCARPGGSLIIVDWGRDPE